MLKLIRIKPIGTLAAFVALVLLAGCGNKGDLQLIDDADADLETLKRVLESTEKEQLPFDELTGDEPGSGDDSDDTSTRKRKKP